MLARRQVAALLCAASCQGVTGATLAPHHRLRCTGNGRAPGGDSLQYCLRRIMLEILIYQFSAGTFPPPQPYKESGEDEKSGSNLKIKLFLL